MDQVAGVEGGTASPPVVPRAARPEDVGEIVRLARQMYQELGAEPPAHGGWVAWTTVAAQVLAGRLGRDVMVFVVDDPRRAGRLASCGAGTIWTALPNPGRQDPRVGYIQWMSTDPEWRRGGRSRAVLRALLEWFEASGVGMVELHASTMGEPLYRSAGFAESRWGTALRRHPLDQMAGKPVP